MENLKQRRNPSSRHTLGIPGAIAREIGIAITSGRYRPGSVLSGEIAASVGYNISRTAYREAIRILAAKGLVASRPKVGTSVTPRENWNLLDMEVLSWTFETGPDPDLLASLFELRNVVETAAAALAAARRTGAQLEAMRCAIEEMTSATLATEEGRRAEQDFRTLLLLASGNLYMISLTSGVNAIVNATTLFKQQRNRRRRMRDPGPDYRRVLAAITAGDSSNAQICAAALVKHAWRDMPIPKAVN
jgi:DNA-binding FadR family transcriptional regulator